MTSLAAATAEIAAWIAANPSVTIAVAFVVAASESVVVVGALVPGTPILMAIGAAASLGHASLWGVVAAATAGAIAGDGLSYWLGHRYRDRLLASWPIASHPILLARGVAFFRRWGALGIALARFVPGVRAVVPVVAGIFRMPALTFYASNIASALVWAPVHILPGALVGLIAGLHLPDHLGHWAIPAAAAIGLILWGLRRLWLRIARSRVIQR